MQKGDWFRVSNRPGQVYEYRYPVSVMRDRDLDYIVAFGGDKNPKGRRQYESFRLDTKFIPTKAPFTRRAKEDEC